MVVEHSLAAAAASFDGEVEQAILSLKKGAQLLKYGRRGKPKFCHFKLSNDEKQLIWYSGKEEKQLRLDMLAKIIHGQKTENFQIQPQPEKESQSFSLIYSNGEHSLDLICKDNVQAQTWLIGLRALISRSHHNRLLGSPKIRRGAQSCANSPIGYTQRKHNLGLLDGSTELSYKVQSLYGSPPRSTTESFSSDCLSYSTDSFYLSEPKPYAPRDVLLWGEGIEGGKLWGGVDIMGTPKDALSPVLLDSTVLLDIQNISFGGNHAALVTKQGGIFCWGEENGGRLGHRINMDVSYPKVIESLSGVYVESVACGQYHTCALTRSGELYTWGDIDKCHWLPRRVSGLLDSIHISMVACGEWHTAVLSSCGELYTYGDGTFGVLGHGNLENVSQPKEVESLRGLRVRFVACGSWHMAAIVDILVNHSKGKSSGGKLFTWGDGDKGKLGHMDRERKLLPTCVGRLVDHDFVQVSCGRMFTVGLTNSGLVLTMGSSMHGQLGNPNPQSEDKSIAIVEGKIKGEFVKQISSGTYHTAVMTSRGRVYTWGKGANGQLGLGDTDDRNCPTLVEALRDWQVETIACGSSFTAAICYRKSIFSSDQSSCNGCKTVFGFTRKKRRCFNCGFEFCRACSSKKIMNVALASNKSKKYHVCDMCFDKLTKFRISDRIIEYEGPCRQPCFSPKISSFEKNSCIGAPSLRKQRKNQKPLGNILVAQQRWGQVACPAHFTTSSGENSVMCMTQSRKESSSASPVLDVMVPYVKNMQIGLSESDQMLSEEIQQLRAEAKSLEKRYLMKNEKLQQYQQVIEEMWLLEKEEAAKYKAAKEIINVLSKRLYGMSEKQFTGSEVNIFSEYGDMEPWHVRSQLFSEGGVLNDKQINQLDLDHVDSSGKDDFSEKVPKSLKQETTEKDEPGVHITFTSLPSGQKGLKRVQFSRKRFSVDEARRWWEENQLRIYQKYEIEV